VEKNNEKDPQGHRFVVRLLDHFQHFGPHGKHVCLVFETMGHNLLHYIKKYDYEGVPLRMVKIMTKQMLAGLHYMHTTCNIIHTDLKPENFLLGNTLSFALFFSSLYYAS
jgi:serine/threonine-protein kinase SRPK3